jgi:RNA polymerase nonessential primary-like sigma factor
LRAQQRRQHALHPLTSQRTPMSETNPHEEARTRAFDLLRLAHESLSASLRYDYFSNGKGHKQSKAVLAPGGARRPAVVLREAVCADDEEDVATLERASTQSTTRDLPTDGADDEAASATDNVWEQALAQSDEVAAEVTDITDRYLAEVSERHRLTSSEEYRLARRAVDGDDDACRQLVEHHLGLVVMMARRYVGRGLPLLDLIEEGNLGLLTAARKFDPELGYRLSTYAKWWIREGIEMALMTQSRVVRVPVHLSRSAKQQAKRLGTATGADDEARGKSLPADLIALLDDDDRDSSLLLAELEAADESRPESALSCHQRQSQVRAALDELTHKERVVIEGRFGLRRDESRTLEAIGQELGLTYERVRQIEKAALVKLRDVFAVRGITWDALL